MKTFGDRVRGWTAALICAGVCACAPLTNGELEAARPSEAHPISVDPQSVTLQIQAEPGAQALSAVDEARCKRATAR